MRKQSLVQTKGEKTLRSLLRSKTFTEARKSKAIGDKNWAESFPDEQGVIVLSVRILFCVLKTQKIEKLARDGSDRAKMYVMRVLQLPGNTVYITEISFKKCS